LRSNPGGLLSSVISVADEFLDGGLILTEAYGNGSEDVFTADGRGLLQEIPLVVLIDEGSASASEVLAGALQDRSRALLVGQTSFGKGTVQAVFTLSNGGGARITTARWLTPDGTWVHEEGITPDYFIPLPELEAGSEVNDTQLQAAVDLLLGRQVESVLPAVTEGDS
jgi:carboxyl-terminal processing protease